VQALSILGEFLGESKDIRYADSKQVPEGSAGPNICLGRQVQQMSTLVLQSADVTGSPSVARHAVTEHDVRQARLPAEVPMLMGEER
jgi:hypothetical protein